MEKSIHLKVKKYKKNSPFIVIDDEEDLEYKFESMIKLYPNSIIVIKGYSASSFFAYEELFSILKRIADKKETVRKFGYQTFNGMIVLFTEKMNKNHHFDELASRCDVFDF